MKREVEEEVRSRVTACLTKFKHRAVEAPETVLIDKFLGSEKFVPEADDRRRSNDVEKARQKGSVGSVTFARMTEFNERQK